MHSTNIIAEIGINHNGSIDLAKKLIDLAAFSGCNYVKFQKRTPDVCVPDSQKDIIKKNTPWGDISYIDYKHKIEFEKNEYDIIDKYCKSQKIKWIASAWDKDSVNFLANYSDMVKIPSPHLTNIDLLRHTKNTFSKRIISTGMSEETQIIDACEIIDPDVIMHTLSTYPSPIDELNLNYINRLKILFPKKQIGYSGHEFGLVTTISTVVLGVSWIERHITLDRNMWGSDQLSSIEPSGLFKLVKGIRILEASLGSDDPRKISPSENVKLESLRG